MKQLFFYIILSLVLGFQASAQPYTHFLPNDLKEKTKAANECFKKGDSSCFGQFYSILSKLEPKSIYYPFVQTSIAIQFVRMGKLDSAASYLINATNEIARGKIINDTAKVILQGEIQNTYAQIHYKEGKLEMAIEEVLAYAKSLEKYGSKEEVINAKMNLASVYSVSENQEMALKINLEAYKDLEAINSTKRKSMLAANIATIYLKKPDYKNAKIWAQKAIVLGKELSYINSVIMGYYTLGACFEKSNQYDSAAINLEIAIQLAKENDRPTQLSAAFMVYGNILNLQKKYVAAAALFEQAIAIQKERGEDYDLIQSYIGAGRANYYLKNYEIAARYLLDYADKNVEVLSEDNRKKVHQLNAKYESEKKEKLIAEKELQIVKKNAQVRQSIFASIILVLGFVVLIVQYRRSQKAKLKKVEQEKEIAVLKAWMNGEERERNRISQELHDGVAAMLGAAKLNLQSIPHLPEEKKQEQYQKIANILDNTHSDVRRIAHNLLPITLQQDGLIAAIHQFAKDLNVTGIIEVSIIDEMSAALMLNKQTQLMLFRIIQELTNNIIKHAQATKANIHFTNDVQTLTVTVSDNGKGFSAIADQDSQGLFSIRERLKSLGGVFDIDSKEGSGTSAVLHISLQKNP